MYKQGLSHVRMVILRIVKESCETHKTVLVSAAKGMSKDKSEACALCLSRVKVLKFVECGGQTLGW